MNKSIYNIALDLHEQISPKALYVKRGDTVRELRVTITEDGKPYEVTSDVTSILCAILSTGSSVETAMTRDGNILTAVLPSSWTATDGEVRCDVSLSSGSDSLRTPGFSIFVGHESGSIPTDARELPSITSADNGKSVVAEDGEWVKGPNLSAMSANIVAMKEVTDEVEEEILCPIPTTINIYDEEHHSEVQTDPQFTIGTVYLDGYEGDVVVSTASNKTAYFTQLHVYNALGQDMGVSFGARVRRTTGPLRDGLIVTVPTGAIYFTFRYRTHTSSSTLISEVMVTKGSTIGDGTYVPYISAPIVLSKAVDEVQERTPALRVAYVSLSGNDSNDGTSIETAFATFSKALSVANTIYAERGVYSQSIDISNRNGISIYPYNNDDSYISGVPRQKIEINGGDKILKTALSTEDNLYKVTYSGGLQFTQVFDTHSLEPVADNGTFRANVFVNLSSLGKLKLKPVITKAGCSGEYNTFFWDAANDILYMNISTANFDSVTVLSASYHINITNCSDIFMQDVAVKYGYTTLIKADNSNNIVLDDCEASYSATSMGFQFNNTNGKLSGCYATNNAFDGFNFHGYGYSELIDCYAMYNFDDGCSHHSGCIGTVMGGEYTGNGKGGMTPAYGANVNIFNILAASNDSYGVAYLYTSGNPAMKSLISGCALVNNPVGMKVGINWTVNAIGLKYSGNTEDKSIQGTLNEY